MSTKLAVLAAVVPLVCGASVLAQAPAKIFPYAYQQLVLDNGFKVIVIPMESPGLVAYYSVVRTGSRDEYEPGHSGFAHFFEHMMFRGTKNFPGAVYDRLVTEMGANANAYTSNDITCYHLEIGTEDLEKTMEVESDRFKNLSYPEDDFKTEAGAVHGEYLKSLANPFFVLRENLANTAFDVHTYKHTVIGFKQDIEAMPTMYQYSLSFFNRYYRPENVVLVLVGDIKPDAAFALAKKYYGDWQKGYVPAQVPVEPEQMGERRLEAAFDGKTLPIFAIGYKGLGFASDNIAVASCLLLGNLAFGETSDIYNKLVLDQQRVEFISADFSPNRDPGLLTIYSRIKDPNDVAGVESEIDSAITSYQTRPVDESRLNDLKSNIRYGFLMGLDTPGKVAGALTDVVSITGGIEALDRFYGTLDRVTSKDIMDAANRFLVREKRTVVLVKGR